MAIILYGVSASPFVRKVRVVLAEKGIPHEREDVVPVNVSAEYRKISPLGKIPAMRDGDRTLSDSSIICTYLERTHPDPALYPAEAVADPQVLDLPFDALYLPFLEAQDYFLPLHVTTARS